MIYFGVFSLFSCVIPLILNGDFLSDYDKDWTAKKNRRRRKNMLNTTVTKTKRQRQTTKTNRQKEDFF